MLRSYEIGKESEQNAANWYLSHYDAKLIAQNYRCFRGEIDLIFEEVYSEGLELVFVEVRSRAPEAWVDGLNSVTWKKKKSLSRAAEYFLMKYRGEAKQVRFDLLYGDGKVWEHLRNIELDNLN